MNSPSLQKIEDTRNKILIDLYNECTEPQQLMFKRCFSHKDLGKPIEKIIEQLPTDKKESAIRLCERTIENNNKKLSQ